MDDRDPSFESYETIRLTFINIGIVVDLARNNPARHSANDQNPSNQIVLIDQSECEINIRNDQEKFC